MRYCMRDVLLGLAMYLATMVNAVVPPAIENVEPYGDDAHLPAGMTKSDYASFQKSYNLTALFNDTSSDTVSTLGYDPSTEWQGIATVEVWTGGPGRKPVDFGDRRGADLSDEIYDILNTSCDLESSKFIASSEWGRCKDHEWKRFSTNALIKGDPVWEVGLRYARIRTLKAAWRTERTRTVMAQIIADTLRAYARKTVGYNCYDIPGQFKGTYCNMPQFVRVNLPHSRDPIFNMATANYWHIETWSADSEHQYAYYGDLKPCKTRRYVDEVMDKYQSVILGLFPEEAGWYRRDARVIINGYRVCSDEP